MTDPYRGNAIPQCLICHAGPLEAEGDGYCCPRRDRDRPYGCGLWDPTIPRVDGRPLATLGNLIEVQLHPRKCPVCEKKMQIRRWSRMTFDVCPGHGLWVAGDDVEYYRQLTG